VQAPRQCARSLSSRMRVIAATGAMLTGAALSGLLPAGASPARAAAAPASECADIEVLTVRGTGEQGTGSVGGAASALATGIGLRVSTYNVPYPATSDWTMSSSAGVAALTSRLTRQSAACPAERFVLMGYSQGAWVIGDALAGSGAGSAPPVSAAIGKKIRAVVLYGDPRFVAAEPYVTGTSTPGVNGVYPRPQGALAAYANRIRSFCYADDTVCQNGATGDGHSRYWQVAGPDAARFARSKLTTAAAPVARPAEPAPSTPEARTPGSARPAAPQPSATSAPAGPTPAPRWWGRVKNYFRLGPVADQAPASLR
jgi:Cutinase